jgi:hypothetical protein
MHAPSFMQQFITGLAYVLAVDDASGSADLEILEGRLAFITSMRRVYGLDETCWSTMHCVRDANPLTYSSPLHEGAGTATAADLATLWREHLHQGLCVPTTGTNGQPASRRALHAFASAPRLVAQVRLVITPTDPAWDSTTYVDELATDLRILQPLWDIPADLPDPDVARLHLVVKATENDMSDTVAAAFDIVRATGLSRTRSYATLADPRLTTFEPIKYAREHATALPDTRANKDLHAVPEDPLRTRFGIHTSGALFSITTRTDTDAAPADATTLLPYSWDRLHSAATRAGWAA